MNLMLKLDQHKVSGHYRTPPAGGMFGGLVQGFGMSIIEGDIAPGTDGGTRMTGTWLHTAGPLEKGTFMVQWSPELKVMKGWWAISGDSSTRHDWIWRPTSTRLQYARSFVQGIAMVRYTMMCCWMYFIMTAISFGYAIEPPPGDHTATHHGIIFNSLYTATYASFVLSYMLLYKKPAMAYSWGVKLYMIGYAAFTIFYAVSLAKLSTTANYFYLLGSVLFLVGSAFLLAATAPVPGGAGKWSPVDIGGSLFWGSITFFIGSVAFTADAIQVVSGKEYTKWLAIAGNAIFVVGRLYFIWGSSTGEVGVFFVPKGIFWSTIEEFGKRSSMMARFSTKGAREVEMAA